MKRILALILCFCFLALNVPVIQAATHTALAVSGTSIKDNQADVKTDSSISIKFNNTITKGPNFKRIGLTTFNKKVDCGISISKNTVIIKPKAAMQDFRYYTLTLPANAIADTSRKPYAKSIIISFRTAAANPMTKTCSLAELQKAFNDMKSSIESMHPKIFTDKEGLQKAYGAQYKLLKDKMTTLEFVRVLHPIVAKLHCGHTKINYSPVFYESLYKNGNFLPVTIKIIDDRAYAVQNVLSSKIPDGSEILSINGRTITDLISIYMDNLTGDGSNTTEKYYIMSNYFNEIYAEFVETPDKFSITYKEPSGNKPINSVISAASEEKVNNALNEKYPPGIHNNEQYYSYFSKDYAGLTIKSFAFYDTDSLSKFNTFIDDFFSELADRKLSSLILDIRDNWGGNPYCTSHLLSYLYDKPVQYFSRTGSGNGYEDLKQPVAPAENTFRGKLFTLINGADFSSSGHLCALMKYYKIGTFLGQETGGSYTCTDGSMEIPLGNTNLSLHCATTQWSVAVSGLTPGRGIMPDVAIAPTVQDYIEKRDPVKEYAIDQIENSKALSQGYSYPRGKAIVSVDLRRYQMIG